MTKLYSILPQLQGEIGHSYEYSICVDKAAMMNGWSHVGWVPQNCPIPTLPTHWKKNLPEKRNFLKYLLCYWKALRQVPPNSVFLLENMNIPHTFTFFVALLLTRKPAQLWIIHRYAIHQMRQKGKWLALLIKWMAWHLGKTNVSLFTDSELLVPQHATLFSRPIHLLPIPHTAGPAPRGSSASIDCWWPGGSTRKEKGLAEIQQVSKLLKTRGHLPLRLIVAKRAEAQGVVASSSVLYIEDNLTRNAYEEWLGRVHIALLPYDPKTYSGSTSGIFAEAIVAGLMPLVRDGSWPSYELRKFALEELILDWGRADLLEHIMDLYRDPKVREKLELMKEAYAKFHCMGHFAETLRAANRQESPRRSKSSGLVNTP